MSKLLIAVALIVAAFAAPARAAEQFTPKDIANIIATATMFNTNCAPLPPRTKRFIDAMIPTADRALLGSEGINVIAEVNEAGLQTWCVAIAHIVGRLEVNLAQ